jgi:hypothetical protein
MTDLVVYDNTIEPKPYRLGLDQSERFPSSDDPSEANDDEFDDDDDQDETDEDELEEDLDDE